MKNTMFKIVGVFSFIAACLALVAAIAVGVTGGSTFMKGAGIWFVDVEKKVKEGDKAPDLGVESFKIQKVLSASKSPTTAKKDTNGGSAKVEDSVFDKKKKELEDKIVGQIAAFAAIAKQDGVNNDGLVNYLEANSVVSGQEYLSFLEKLSADFGSLSSKASEMSILSTSDPKYVGWMEYVQWYTEAYMGHIKEQQDKIDAKKSEAVLQQAEGLKLLMYAAAPFCAFISFIMLLLIVQIEKNTRKEMA